MNSSIQIAVDILSALLTGGFLLFFIETMHIESDVKQRFKSIMNPFYHKLSKMSVFVGHMQYAIRFPKDRLGEDLKKNIEYISKAGIVPMTSGRDISYMRGEELEKLCETFNNIWYHLDRYPALRRSIEIDDGGGLDTATEALIEVYPKYKNKRIDVDALRDATGAFYNEYWEPVAHCTPNYEYWKSRAKATRILVFCALGISLLSLIFIMLWAECICVEIPCIFAIISSVVFATCVGMMAHLISLSNRLFRAV